MSNLAIANISWKYYLVFICLNAVDFIVIAFFFPETKGASRPVHRAISVDVGTLTLIDPPQPAGKTLEQMAEIFGDDVDAHDVLASAAAHEKLEHDNLEKA